MTVTEVFVHGSLRSNGGNHELPSG